ncbi:MAG: HAMP domain-containing histidine kinase [Kiritimatiellae bacterium]|nr:HAMP domain-containing histidine kinase [Kiritimatiellia bacterium]
MASSRPFLPPDAPPLRTAVMIAVSYGGFCLAVILLSSYLVSLLSVSRVQLTELEFWKGIAFVAISTALVFFFSLVLLQRVTERERELARHREALLAAERRAVAGVFASAVAHDINNALSVFHEVLGDHAPSPADLERLRVALAMLDRMTRLLLQAGRDSRVGDPEEFDLPALVREMVDLARIHSRCRSCRIEVEVPERLVCRGHPGLMRQSLLNLILNAAEATGGVGHIRVRVVSAPDGVICVDVDDNGPGVSPAYRARLFEPFFTTRPQGTGLGLVSVRAAAELHGGTAEYDISDLGGARFRIRLPSRLRVGI